MANDIPAVYGLNRYIWAKIEEAGILDKANYGGLTPIIPTMEVAQFTQAMDAQNGIKSFPYIVYNWNTNGYAQDWFQSSDQIIYLINATDGKKLRELILLILDHFKRYDESAQAVNDFIQGSALSDKYKAYHYKSINIQSATGGSYASQENEPITAMITVKATYTTTDGDLPL